MSNVRIEKIETEELDEEEIEEAKQAIEGGA